MTMPKTLVAVVGVLALALSASSVGATVISINHVGPDSNDALAAGEVAGAVPVANWNNSPVMLPAGGGAITYGPLALNFDDGTPSGATAGLSSTNGWKYDNGYTGSPDAKMMAGGSLFDTNDNAVLTLSNVPFAVYDVYVYGSVQGGAANTPRVGLTAANGSWSIQWTQDTSFSGLDDATTDGAGNYVSFRGVSGGTLTLNLDDASVGRAGYMGFQVVQIPEPATLLIWSLLAGLGIGVAWRRRNR